MYAKYRRPPASASHMMRSVNPVAAIIPASAASPIVICWPLMMWWRSRCSGQAAADMFVGTYTSTWRSPRRTRSVRDLAGAQQALRDSVDGGLCEERQPGAHGTVLLFLDELVERGVGERVLGRGAVDDRHVPAADRHPVGEDELGEQPAGHAQPNSPGVQPRLPGGVFMRDEVVLVS